MNKQRVSPSVLTDRLRVRAAFCAACGGAAVLAIGIALVAMTALFLVLGALGVNSAPDSLSSAVQDAAVALYAVQLVGISFFNQTAELRFAAIPGLLLVGLAIVAATAVAARSVRGSARRKMTVALVVPVPYAVLMGLTALFVPLHFTAPGFGVGVAVSPSPAEAFLLPLGWGLLFASIGGLIGTFGRDWRRAASRLLGAWGAPLASSLRVLTVSLAAGAVVALVGVLATTGADLSSVTGGGLGHAIKVAGGTLIALPTLAAAVIVSGFGVPFGWRVDALSHGAGSISAFGGTLPSGSADASQAQSAPGVFALAPLIALATVLAIGWLSARRSGSDARLGLGNAVRAATLTTLAVWLLALLARVDAQAGGLLGLHLTPDVGVLLWSVPLVAFAGCLASGLAWVLTRGPAARRQLAAPRPAWVHQGLTWRAALGLGLAVLPVALLGVGATGTATSAAPGEVSMTPIEEGAEQVLERASTKDESVAVTVNPETRVVGTASVNTPLRALDIAPGQSRPAKAEDVLGEYGELFGLADPGNELGNAEATTDDHGVTHISFAQMANGLPVYGGGLSVHLSNKGELLSFVAGSVIPDVFIADDKARLSSAEATEVAKQALPSGSPAEPPTMQVYAGMSPYLSGPNARLAWFVWLIGEEEGESAEYVVDAVTGDILDTIPKAHHAKVRKVHDWNGGPKLPGVLVREEGDPPTGDNDTDAAYDNSGIVYDFYNEFAERDSYNDKGAPIVSTVHFTEPNGEPFENAYWNGEQMVFGDGYADSLDVVGHELTHAVTEKTVELVPSGQSGALNESFSDIVGEVIEWTQSEAVDWEMGTNLPNGPFRSLKEPNDYSELAGAGINKPNPKKLAEWIVTCLDNFGMHINSTITSHAFYLAATKPGMNPLETWLLFYEGWTKYLSVPSPTLEAARAAVLQAAKEGFGEGSTEYKAIESAFNTVGLNGVAQPPALQDCAIQCSFQGALYKQRQSVTGDAAIEMLSTLYKARGELAMTTVAGDHFLPLYEGHMERITELVSQDPVLAEMTVSGLEEVTPALEGLMEGEGEKFELTAEQMDKIEAALNRLAEDDRLYSGEDAGELADVIDDELRWLGLPSYAGMNYESGFARLNEESEGQMMMLETGEIIEPNCTGQPYSNDFHVNAFYADTGAYTIPGQVSPINAGGIICGSLIEEKAGKKECTGEESLNTEASVTLPPGDKVNSSKNLPAKSWVGKVVGRAFACAGKETQMIYGEGGLLSLSRLERLSVPGGGARLLRRKKHVQKRRRLRHR